MVILKKRDGAYQGIQYLSTNTQNALDPFVFLELAACRVSYTKEA